MTVSIMKTREETNGLQNMIHSSEDWHGETGTCAAVVLLLWLMLMGKLDWY